MNKLTSSIGIFTLAMGVTVGAWADHPCHPIAQECMKLGYYKGGNGAGKGLIKDCVMPVVSGTKTLPNTNFTPDQLQQCSAMIQQKMQNKMQNKMQTTQ